LEPVIEILLIGDVDPAAFDAMTGTLKSLNELFATEAIGDERVQFALPHG
jgi:hypothetical protein